MKSRPLFHQKYSGLVLLLSFLSFTASYADITTMPPGLNPGDQYRLVFITKDKIFTAESSNIGDYDALVTAQANTSADLVDLGTTWRVIGSTSSVSAKDHTDTDDSPAGSNGVPIYRLDGAIIADDYDDLWNGSIQNPLYVAQDGTVLDTCCGTWTGTNSDGTAATGNELGAGVGVSVVDGAPNGTGANWVQTNPFPPAELQFLYAISDVLTVVGPTVEITIDIEKLTNGNDADGANDSDVPRIVQGETVTWTYQVTNNGETELSFDEISVTDSQPGVTPVLNTNSDTGDMILSPAETWTYTATAQALDLTTPPTDVTVVLGCNDGRNTYANIGRVEIAGTGIFDEDPSHYCNVSNPATTPVASILPSSRSVQVGNVATAFATIINTGSSTATDCGIAPLTSVQANFSYQTTDASNALVGVPDTPIDIAAGGNQSYVFALTPTASFSPVDVHLIFDCTNTDPAPVTVGLNTLLLVADSNPVPDIVALSATLTGDGIVNLENTGVFAVATVNVGVAGNITVSADTGSASLPVSIALCETNPVTGVCINPTVPTLEPVTTLIAANATPTFAFFVTSMDTVPFDPANNRIFVRFRDVVTRGSTSVAIMTQ